MRFLPSIFCLAVLSKKVTMVYGDEVTVDEMGNPKKIWKFGMASGGSSFFDTIRQGFEETCALLGKDEGVDVQCEYFAENNTFFRANYNESEELAHCVPQIRSMMEQKFDGISLYCGVDHPVLQQARDAGIVLSSFDIRPPLPMPYVGTDNSNIGESMARLLRLLKHIEPGKTGTYYAFSFTRIPERYQGFVEEIEKNNHRMDRGHWKMITTNLTGKPQGDDLLIGEEMTDMNQNGTLDRLALLNPDAIIFMNQSPMRRAGYTEWVQRNRHRNITLIGLPGSDQELKTLARRNVDGLIGQVTFDIGRLSAETLYDLKAGKDVPPVRFTKLINYNLVPEVLPGQKVDENLLDNLKIVGYVCFSVVALSTFACMAWTVYHRKGTVVRSSQPMFLIMTATGILIMAAAIIPLSFDAGDNDDYSEMWARGVCMSVPWLASIGFSVTFSGLFAKTWRVNQFFKSDKRFARIQVREKDVLAPFAVVMSLNIVILVIWTAVDPLTYTREFEDGTDLYNREIASNGYCRSDHAEYFLLPLAIVNLILLGVACFQAYNARNIKSEFAEATYIFLAVFSLMQAFITGIPVVAVVKDDPQAFYLVLTCMIFVLSMVILLLIFLPKFLMERKYATMSPADRRRSLAVSVRASTHGSSGSSHDPAAPRISGLTPPPLPRRTLPRPTGAAMQPIKEVSRGNVETEKKDEEEQRDLTNSTTSDQYGSLVEKVDDVLEYKKSTYASEELESELKDLEEKEKQETTNSEEQDAQSFPNCSAHE